MDSWTGSQVAFFYPQPAFTRLQAVESIDWLLLPTSVAVASAALLLLHFSVSRLSASRHDSQNLAPGIRGHVSDLGGSVIFGYYLVRLAACVALTGVSTAQYFKKEEDGLVFIAQLSVFAYSTALALVSVLANWRWSRNAIRHLNIVLWVMLALYAYRDVYPLGTFELIPQDEKEGRFLWAKFLLLALAGVVVPLTVPRKYIPADPKHPKVPNPEQTCSILSRLIFGFLDPVIWKAYHSESLPYDDLPPLADYDDAEYLKKRSFRYLDPTIITKRRNVFFSLVRVFAYDFMVLSVLVMLQSVLDFTTPIGIKNLLGYIETGGLNAFFKPWVWILWLFVGPLLQTMASESYLYISTRQLVHVEAILTETILEHALRIRVKAETSEKEKPSITPASASGTTTPSPPSERAPSENGDSGSNSEDDQGTLHSRDTTLQAGSSVAGSSHDSSSSTIRKDTETVKVAPSSVTPSPEPSSAATPPPKVETKNILGKVNNLVTTDMQQITDGKDALRLIINVPIQIALCVVFLYNVLGWSSFVGLATIIILLPVPGVFTKLMQNSQKMKMKKTDGRIQMVTETMSVLRMVKFFGWERMMNDRIKDAREQELTLIRRLRLLELGASLTNYIIPTVTMIATYATYTTVMKQELSASKVFSSMVVFEKFSMVMFRVMYYVTQSVNAKVSLDRVTEFLYETELLDSFTSKSNHSLPLPAALPPTQEIGFRNATFSWSNEYSDGSMTPSRRKFLLKIDGELLFLKGAINLIIGSTGSGKTSMLMALLSEMHFMPSGPDSWYNLPRENGLAYAAQESWIENATIKENIVFGADFDEERYRKVLYQCALERDLELFQAGDATEVGEKGLTLSGGQKARVTLARAIYSKAEIILLDDVLAALDVHTSKWIVDKCFKGDLIRDRTILLVTHNVALAQSIAGFVVSIKDGRVLSQGTVKDALSKDKALASEFQAEESINATVEEEIDDGGDKPKNPAGGEGKLIVEEEIQIGNVGWPALRLLLKGLGGHHAALFFASFFATFLVAEVGDIFQTWFLGYWASQYEIQDPSQVNVAFYLVGYSLILLFVVINYCIGNIIYMFAVLRASRTIHKQLVKSVLGTTMRWLDTTPTSRVITRATQDMRDVDGPLPGQLNALVRLTIMMAGQFCSIIFFSPSFAFPGLLLSIAGALFGAVYIKAQLPIKRVQSNAKSPVLGHFGTVMSGLVSVRAYGVQNRFISESLSRINYYSRPSRVFWNINRWIDVRLDLMGNIFSASLAFYLVYVTHGQASTIGFSLNMAVMFSSSILYYIRILNMFQVRSNSLERINAYIEIEQERQPSKEGVPPAHWPSSGDLRVENLNARYSSNGPQVLQDINFHVKSGERIGVVGRTGSGKSSLMLSLLKMIYTGGEVYLDGVPTSTVNLDDLRTKITIIPQMPELLSGTVRRNLDPFDQHDDATLYDALRSAGLYSIQSDDEDARVTLDSAVASGGGNLSVGQRQIIALARAMVRESKLLILDEATSAIDYTTDSVIQAALRNELKSDTTLITVAHRLQTIMDADKIMVLDAGRIVEYDTPKELLKNKTGHLRALVDESADKDRLYQMAEGSGGRT